MRAKRGTHAVLFNSSVVPLSGGAGRSGEQVRVQLAAPISDPLGVRLIFESSMGAPTLRTGASRRRPRQRVTTSAPPVAVDCFLRRYLAQRVDIENLAQVQQDYHTLTDLHYTVEEPLRGFGSNRRRRLHVFHRDVHHIRH